MKSIGKSQWLAERYLDWRRGSTMPAPPVEMFVGLFEKKAGSFIGTFECVDRQKIEWSSVDGNTIRNTNKIEFPAFTEPRTITAVGTFDSKIGGNLIDFREIDSLTIDVAGVVRFDPGSLTVMEG
jgi:hypothetical protein